MNSMKLGIFHAKRMKIPVLKNPSNDGSTQFFRIGLVKSDFAGTKKTKD